MEKLTRELIESHLFSCIDVTSEVQSDGVERWAWSLTQMALPEQRYIDPRRQAAGSALEIPS